MNRRVVVVICMLDSIHSARWLSQFKDQSITFIVFPSSKHRHLHPQIAELLNGKTNAKFELFMGNRLKNICGYLDFVFLYLPLKFFNLDFRSRLLSKILVQKRVDVIHALEIQGAGYLVLNANAIRKIDAQLIVTNWGSDIYFYSSQPDHREKIKSVLKLATHYSAECVRDYELATQLGFSGINLPCIPNAGGFQLNYFKNQVKTSIRSNIVVKSYGGTFGRGDLIIIAIRRILSEYSNFSLLLYSVTDDLNEAAENLMLDFPSRVTFSTRRKPLEQPKLFDIFLASRVYVGASRSDGISTSFLEALISGCYPIQTNTSCADEWVERGAVGTLVSQSADEIYEATRQALEDDVLVDEAQQKNTEIASRYLSIEKVRDQALDFYKF